MKKISLNKEKKNSFSLKLFFIILKKNILLFILIMTVTTFIGSGFAIAFSKDLYYSKGNVLYSDSAHVSSIMAIANMADADIVYEKTVENLKNNKVYINNSLEYSSEDIRKITKITPILTSSTIEIKCTSEEKNIVKKVVDFMIDNAIEVGISYPLFKDHIIVNNYGCNPTLISSGKLYKILAAFGSGFILGIFAALLKNNYKRKIIDVEEINNLGLNAIKIADDNLECEKNNIVLNTLSIDNSFIIFSMGDINSNFLFNSIRQLVLNGKTLVINLVDYFYDENNNSEFEIKQYSENIDIFAFNNSLSSVLLLKNEKNISIIEELAKDYEYVFIYCNNNLYFRDVYLLKNIANNLLMYVKSENVRYDEFIFSYERLPEDVNIDIIFDGN